MLRDVQFASPDNCPPEVLFVKGRWFSSAAGSVVRAIREGDRRIMFWQKPENKKNKPITGNTWNFYCDRVFHSNKFSFTANLHFDIGLADIRSFREKIRGGFRVSDPHTGVGSYFYYIGGDEATRRRIIDSIRSDHHGTLPEETLQHLKGPFAPRVGQAGFILSDRFGDLATLHSEPYIYPTAPGVCDRSILEVMPYPWVR